MYALSMVSRESSIATSILAHDITLRPPRSDEMWKNICPETALLVRVFVEHCIQTKQEAKLESSLPVVTALAFHMQRQYNAFLDSLQHAETQGLSRIDEDDMETDDKSDTLEEAITDATFILSEMVRLAVHLDYADEIGRRKMFGILRTS